jgi:hypothetical protein
MTQQISVDLRITSSLLSREDLASRISLAPTRTWRLGDPIEKTSLVRRSHGWELLSGLDETASLEVQLTNLLAKIEPIQAEIAALRDVADVLISCAIYCSSQPELYISRELIQRISNIGAALDFDVYWSHSSPESEGDAISEIH